MRKNRTPTIADLETGNVTKEELKQFYEQIDQVGKIIRNSMELVKTTVGQEIKKITENYEAWENEAIALFDAIKDAGLPEIETYISQHPPSAGAIAVLILVAQDRFKSEQARKNAEKSNAPKTKAREFVQREWGNHKDGYDNNKSAFARDYANRVKREMGIDVTEKTIRERWLK